MTAHSESIAFWNQHQVAEFDRDVTEEESLLKLEWRNNLYPGLLKLMPVSYPGSDVLDFGCGPGHDTIQFLLNGARHVTAADPSRKGVEAVLARLKVHGLEDRCTIHWLGETWAFPKNSFDHIHAAGVIHHLAHPVPVLRKLARALRPQGEIRMMVYSSESQFFQNHCKGDIELFRQNVDHGAPIINAWSRAQVVGLACAAGLAATYRGSYRIPSETKGPGLSACYSLS